MAAADGEPAVSDFVEDVRGLKRTIDSLTVTQKELARMVRRVLHFRGETQRRDEVRRFLNMLISVIMRFDSKNPGEIGLLKQIEDIRGQWGVRRPAI